MTTNVGGNAPRLNPRFLLMRLSAPLTTWTGGWSVAFNDQWYFETLPFSPLANDAPQARFNAANFINQLHLIQIGGFDVTWTRNGRRNRVRVKNTQIPTT